MVNKQPKTNTIINFIFLFYIVNITLVCLGRNMIMINKKFQKN